MESDIPWMCVTASNCFGNGITYLIIQYRNVEARETRDTSLNKEVDAAFYDI